MSLMVSTSDALAIFILCLILVTFLAIRVNPIPESDALHYVAMVQQFRGKSPDIQPQAPFTYRVLVPLLAAPLPFPPAVAINIINTVALIAGTIFVYLTLAHLSIPLLMRFTGGLLFVLSPAHLNFAVSGYIDAALIGFLCAGLYFILTGRYEMAAVVVIFGSLAKETMVILFPVWLVHILFRNPNKLYAYGCGIFGTTVALGLVRFLSGAAGYLWLPGAENLDTNLVIGHTLNVVFVFGIVGFLAIPQLAKRQNLVLTTGYVMAILLTIYAALAAWLDGRHIWAIYPFAIPLATMTLQDIAWRLSRF